MAKLTFYRQGRADGGIRTGIDVDGVRALEHFEKGPDELADEFWGSTLRWYVDLIAEGEGLPDDTEGSREWFLTHERVFVEELREVSEKLSVGIDDVDVPLRWTRFREAPEGVAITLLVHATKRVEPNELSEALGTMADRWRELIAQLAPFSLAR